MMISKRALGVFIVFLAIVVLSFVTNPKIVPKSVSDAVSSSRKCLVGDDRLPGAIRHGSPHKITDRTFLLLKTGVEVAYTRLPAHFDTSFDIFPHHAVYADTSDVIDGMPMFDAISFLDEETLNHPALEAYRVRRQASKYGWHWGSDRVNVPGDPKGGWNLDRFKNVPAFAHAYLNNPGFDWYYMMDADSYITASTLEQVTKDKNVSEPIYLGKAVGAGTDIFAHGGSGILFSRGAMELMFGSTEETAMEAVALSGSHAVHECCGDEVASFVYRNRTRHEPGNTLQYNEVGQFQGDPPSHQHVMFNEWCKPVGTFHFLSPWDVVDIYKWEISKGDKILHYADFYHDFIMPGAVAEKNDWFIDYSNSGIDKVVYDHQYDEAHDKQKCIQACHNDENCTMWEILRGESCVLFRQSVARGKAMNRYSKDWEDKWSETTVGYMVDRIKDFRTHQSCDPANDKSEGWAFTAVEPGKIDLKPASLHTKPNLHDDPKDPHNSLPGPHDDPHDPHDGPHDSHDGPHGPPSHDGPNDHGEPHD